MLLLGAQEPWYKQQRLRWARLEEAGFRFAPPPRLTERFGVEIHDRREEPVFDTALIYVKPGPSAHDTDTRLLELCERLANLK